MKETLAASAIGAAASLISAVQVSRQVYDVYRHPDPSGVSLLTWELALVQSSGLLVLSWHRQLVVAVLINLYVGVAAVLLLLRLGPGGHGRQARRGATLTGTTALAFLVVTATVGPVTSGTIGAMGSALVWIPQGLHSLRNRSAAGLSWMGVGAGLVSSALWLAYATAVGEWRFAVAPLAALAALAVTGVYGLAKATVR